MLLNKEASSANVTCQSQAYLLPDVWEANKFSDEMRLQLKKLDRSPIYQINLDITNPNANKKPLKKWKLTARNLQLLTISGRS